jgi:glycine/D-amino acid oxidase-like deaminating enzyme
MMRTAVVGTYDTVVIGGGLHGCSAALHLALRGRRVLVIEKDYSGRHASGVNAGGVRRLGRHPAEVPLSVESLEMWYGIESLVGSDCGFQPTGQVKIAESDAEMVAVEARAALVRSLGFDHEEVVGRDALRRLCPAAAPHCVGAIVCRRDGFANPYRTTRAFHDKARSLGVTIREGVRVTGLDRAGDAWEVGTTAGRFRAETLLNCAGAWADQVAAMLGDRVPLSPVALMMMVTAPTAPFLDPVVGLMGRALSFKQGTNGTVVIGGGYRGVADRDTGETRLDLDGMRQSARTVVEVFPHMRHVPLVRGWAGIEGFLPDQIPVIGPSRHAPAACHAFGFCGHGFQLGPIVGRLMAELIVDGKASLPIEPFRVDRFNAVDAAGDGATTAG